MEQELENNMEADEPELTINMNSCRICLKTHNEPMCLLYERVRTVSYADMLRCVTRIKAKPEEQLPDKICFKCRAALERAFIFKAEAEKSDARLKLLKQIDYDFSTPSVKIEYFDNEEYENVDFSTPSVKIEYFDNEEYENVDFSTPSVKIEYFDNEEYENVVYSEDCDEAEDLKEQGNGADSVDVKREDFIEYDDGDPEEYNEEYLEVVNENKLSYDGDFYNSKVETKEFELDTSVLEQNELETALGKNSQFRKEMNKEVADIKDKHKPRAKSKSRRKSPSESKDRERLICPICGLLVVYLTQHLKSHNERVLQCPECPKTFHKRKNLRMHQKYHTGIKNYVCSVCGIAFYDSRGLNRHSSVHTGVKPYSCEVCNKTFVARNTLKLHMEIHAGTKRYKCEVCGTNFRVSHQLKAHSIIHTGDKPYHCEICNIGFSYKVKLNNHVQKVHNINLKFKSVHSFTQELFLEAQLNPDLASFIEDEDEINGYVEIDQTEMVQEEIDQTGMVQEEIDQTGMVQEEVDQTGILQEEIDDTTSDQEFTNQENIEQDQMIISVKDDANDSDERLVLSMIMPDDM